MSDFELSRVSGLIVGTLVATLGLTFGAGNLVSYCLKTLIP